MGLIIRPLGRLMGRRRILGAGSAHYEANVSARILGIDPDGVGELPGGTGVVEAIDVRASTPFTMFRAPRLQGVSSDAGTADFNIRGQKALAG